MSEFRLSLAGAWVYLAALGVVAAMRQQEADGAQAPGAGGRRLGRVGAAGQDRKVVRGDGDGGAGDEPVERTETPGDHARQSGSTERHRQPSNSGVVLMATYSWIWS